MDSRTQANGVDGVKPRRIPLSYKHTRQIDKTYQAANIPSRQARKIRVTSDTEGKILDMIVKENLGHLNIYSPRTRFDWRISINNERKGTLLFFRYILITVEGGLPDGVELRSERKKDRITYIHQHCQIDLTQVINVFPIICP